MWMWRRSTMNYGARCGLTVVIMATMHRHWRWRASKRRVEEMMCQRRRRVRVAAGVGVMRVERRRGGGTGDRGGRPVRVDGQVLIRHSTIRRMRRGCCKLMVWRKNLMCTKLHLPSSRLCRTLYPISAFDDVRLEADRPWTAVQLQEQTTSIAEHRACLIASPEGCS